MSSHIDGIAINYVISQPVGVAGLISPWNLPLYLLTWKIAPAIATGFATEQPSDCSATCAPIYQSATHITTAATDSTQT